jgi:hypothetical protein
MLLAALSPLGEADEGVKYSGIASVHCRAEMVTGELLSIHKIWTYLRA